MSQKTSPQKNQSVQSVEQAFPDQKIKPFEKALSVQQEEFSEHNNSSSDQKDFNEIEMDESLIKFDFASYLPDSQNIGGIETFWKTGFEMKFFSERPIKSAILEPEADGKITTSAVLKTETAGKLKWQIVDFISFYGQALIIGRNGFEQSIHGEERRSGLHILEQYFDLKLPYLIFRFGAIKQDFLQAPLLITDKTFPSLIQEFSFDWQNKAKLTVFLQEAIMSNAGEITKRESQIIKGFPPFLTSSFFFDFDDFMEVDIKEKLTFFYMANLSPAIANRSRIYGNRIRGQRSDSQFEYKFLGFYNSLNVKKTLSDKWILEVGGDMIYNFLAPDAYNQGERLYSSLYHNYKDFIELKLTGEYFANQSDTSVAYFNSELYGHNNRVGGRFSLQSHFYSSGLTLGLSYIGSLPINGKGSPIGFSSAFAFFLRSNYVSI